MVDWDSHSPSASDSITVPVANGPTEFPTDNLETGCFIAADGSVRTAKFVTQDLEFCGLIPDNGVLGPDESAILSVSDTLHS